MLNNDGPCFKCGKIIGKKDLRWYVDECDETTRCCIRCSSLYPEDFFLAYDLNRLEYVEVDIRHIESDSEKCKRLDNRIKRLELFGATTEDMVVVREFEEYFAVLRSELETYINDYNTEVASGNGNEIMFCFTDRPPKISVESIFPSLVQ